MMHAEREYATTPGTKQETAKQGTIPQIETRLPLTLKEGDLLFFRQIPVDDKFFNRTFYSRGLKNDLDRLAVNDRKYGPQRLMPLHDLSQRRFEHPGIQIALDPECSRHMISLRCLLKIDQHPQSLLRDRNRVIRSFFYGWDSLSRNIRRQHCPRQNY